MDSQALIESMDSDTKHAARLIVRSNLHLVNLLLRVPEDKLKEKLSDVKLHITRELLKLGNE